MGTPSWRIRAAVLAAAAALALTAAVMRSDTGDQPTSLDTTEDAAPVTPDRPVDRADDDAATTTSGITTTTHGDTTSTTGVDDDDGTEPRTDLAPSQPPPPIVGPGDGPEPPAGPTTTTTTCADSFDPGCGTFRWTQAPGRNLPATYEISIDPTHPKVGERVHFTVTVTDPDATPQLPSVWIGDEDLTRGNCYAPHGVRQGYGPWNPPVPRGGTATGVTRYTFTSPGTVVLTMCAATVSWPPPLGGGVLQETWCPGDPRHWAFEGYACHDPYGDFLSPTLTIEVAP